MDKKVYLVNSSSFSFRLTLILCGARRVGAGQKPVKCRVAGSDRAEALG